MIALVVVAITRVIQLSPIALSVLISPVLPILTGLIMRTSNSSGAKAVVNLFLSALAGSLTTLVAAKGALVWQEFVLSIGIAWVSSIALHYGFWKPTGVTASLKK